MASISSPWYRAISHCVRQWQIISQTQTQITTPLINLHIHVGFTIRSNTIPYFRQRVLYFSLDHMLNPHLLHQRLAPTFARLRIDTSSTHYWSFLQQIMDCAIQTLNTHGFEILYLESEILVELGIGSETRMRRALALSAFDFEQNNYGMVAATESSVREMVTRIKVEDSAKQNCVVCLEELGVGFEASRMPCSHIFHAHCIETWLKRSHSCPICRYQMPTESR